VSPAVERLKLPNPLEIKIGGVYTSIAGEHRLVTSFGRGSSNPVVIWRTIDPSLPKGVKAQGSATLASFQYWAVSMRESTKADWDAFQEVERRREWQADEARFIRQFKRKRTSAAQ